MNTIFLIDAKAERRAEAGRVLLQGDRHLEPFETVAEFLAFARSDGVALIHDDSGAAARLCEALRDDPRLVPVIAYAEAPEHEGVVATMQAGAASYLAWPFALAGFDAEMARIGPALRESLERKRRTARARSLIAGLTPREREVLMSLISHGTNKAIAKHLDISPRTVEKYRAAILVRLGVDNSAQAIRLAVEGDAYEEAARDNASADDTEAMLHGASAAD